MQFQSVAETASQAGWSQVNLSATADGVTNTTLQSGYNTAVGNTPSTTLRVTYTTATPFNRVRGLRLWNQCGGDLNDADGLGNFDAEFYDGVTLLATHSFTGLNGGTAQNLLIPALGELNGVTSVVLRSLSKQIGGSVAPLWRELQLLVIRQVYPCRRSNGTVEWYDIDGNLVPQADVGPCAAEPANIVQPTPFALPDLRMNGAAFGDDPSGTAENMCAIVPTPATNTGWAAPVGGCYDPVVGNPSMTWTATTSVEMSYDDNGNGQASGGVIIAFLSPTLGNITWPTNLVNMNVGESRTSDLFGGGRRAVLTYVSGPPATPSGTIRMEGGTSIGLHRLSTTNEAPIRFRLDFFTI